MHRGTDCAEGNQSRLSSAQNITLCTKCSALHKTSPYTGPTSYHPAPRRQPTHYSPPQASRPDQQTPRTRLSPGDVPDVVAVNVP